MRISWHEFVKQRFSRPSKFYSIGIEFGNNELHISIFQKKSGNLVWVKQHSLPIVNWAAQLKRYVELHNINRTSCHIVLATNYYQILQVDKPEVEPGELPQALIWLVREQVPGTEEIIFDFFDYPGTTTGKERVNVVAVNKKDVLDICKGIRKAELKLTSIGIEELATCDLLPRSDDAVITLFQGQNGQVCLNIVKQGQLYFSRRLRGFENLASFSTDELKMGIGDTLSVEIQRSMDYFESQFRQAPVKKILLAVNAANQPAFAELIEQLTFMPVEIFSPSIAAQSDGLQATSLASLGGALRMQIAASEVGQ